MSALEKFVWRLIAFAMFCVSLLGSTIGVTSLRAVLDGDSSQVLPSAMAFGIAIFLAMGAFGVVFDRVIQHGSEAEAVR